MSPSSPWTPELAIGVAEIDEQHEQLFALCTAFVDGVGAARSEQLVDLLAHLGSYIVKHFATEESLMASTEYPDMEAHVREHRAFQRTFARLVSSFARYGDEARVVADVKSEVTEWLAHHVATSDRLLGEHLHARGLRAA